MSDILLDPKTGDIAMVGCSPVLTTNLAELVAQRLHIRLNTFEGEWFYDSSVGVPYFQDILINRFNKYIIDNTIRRIILETEDVINLLKYEGVFNPELRVYEITYSVEITQSPTNGSVNKIDKPYVSGNIIDNLKNSIVLSGGDNLVYKTTNPNFKC